MELTMTKLENCKALINCYGLTECVPISSESDFADENNVKLADIPPFSVGKVSPGVLLQIRNPETGEILKTNERGEICVKSPSMFSHYLNNPEASASAFIDGFFRTGDLGYYDENQFLFLVDRIKEIFKYWNNHISPSEVEDIINQHEAVGEVCVVGIEDPEGGGFFPRAYVTLIDTECPKEEIIKFAHERLSNYKHLRGGLYIVPELPKGKTGKIQRSLVAQMTLPEEDENETNADDQPEETNENKEEEEETKVENPEDTETENNEDQEAEVENEETEKEEKEKDEAETGNLQDVEGEQNEEDKVEKDENENPTESDNKEETEIVPVEEEGEESEQQDEEDSKEEKPEDAESKEEENEDAYETEVEEKQEETESKDEENPDEDESKDEEKQEKDQSKEVEKQDEE